MPPSRLVLPPRLLRHPARTTPVTASAAMAMVAGAAGVAAERIADRARVLNARVTRGRFGARCYASPRMRKSPRMLRSNERRCCDWRVDYSPGTKDPCAAGSEPRARNELNHKPKRSR
jgi:hypothetical protein